MSFQVTLPNPTSMPDVLYGKVLSGMFANNEQGVVYDVGDYVRYMQTGVELVTGTWKTPVGYNNITTGSGSSFSTTGAGSPSRVAQVANTVAAPGRLYQVSFRVVSTTATVSLFVRDGAVEGSGTVLATTNAVVGSIQTLSFSAPSAAVNLLFTTAASADYAIDNISVRELTAIDTCTLFQDSAGTTPVTAVEQPVGLMLDRKRGTVLGPELYSGGNITGVPIGGAAFNNYLLGINVEAGKSYRLSINVSGYSGTNTYSVGGIFGTDWVFSTVARTGDGLWTFTLIALRASPLSLFTRSTNTANFSNISVRELPGNHAYQTTAIDRPILRNRYNLLTKTEQFDDAAWNKATSNGTAPPVVTGNYALDPLGGMTADRVQLTLPGDTEWSLVRMVGTIASIPAGVPVTISLWVKAENPSQVGKFISLYAYNVTAASYASGNRVSKHVLTDEWQRVESTFSFGSISSTQEFSVGKARSIVNEGITNAATATDFLVWGSQFVFTDQAHLPYQRVNTSTDYDSDPSKFPLYLAANGTNTWMQTNSIDFSSTDKVTVFAGVRKLSDAAVGMVVELSTSAIAGNPGTLYIVGSSPTGMYQGRTAGTQFQTVNSAAYSAPHSSVLCLKGDIAGDSMVLRVNGIQTSNSLDQGSGNFGNYPLYLFRRGGTNLPFNGNFYGLVIRGALTNEDHIVDVERLLAFKTRGFVS